MTEPARQKQLVIDRTLSPLDKLVSQTRTLTSKQPPSSLFINTAPPPPPTTTTATTTSQQHQQQSFSLTPLSTEPNHLAQQQHSLAPLHNPFNHRNSDASFQSDNTRYSFEQSVQLPSDYHDPHHLASPFDIDSALAQLSNSLRDLDQSAIPDHPPAPLRRPSTGRVNSSTATTQTPREHIPSFYGDQELILPSDHSPSHSPRPDLPHHHHHHHHLDNTQEVIGPAQAHRTLKDRQTWLSSLSADSESEYDAQSARYPSGHSTSSEDPFQYWVSLLCSALLLHPTPFWPD
jgi:hypothetical protein